MKSCVVFRVTSTNNCYYKKFRISLSDSKISGFNVHKIEENRNFLWINLLNDNIKEKRMCIFCILNEAGLTL